MKTAEERFLSKVKKSESGCWEWTAYIHLNGYAQFKFQGRTKLGHRVSWVLFVGEIPEGKQINHKCHNRKCVNPDHLYVGTQKENENDKIKDGTVLDGEKNHFAKLTEREVKDIRCLLGLGATQTLLAKEYGVGKTTIGNIKRNETWKYYGSK